MGNIQKKKKILLYNFFENIYLHLNFEENHMFKFLTISCKKTKQGIRVLILNLTK